ncbi:DUF4097 domain-containing protein [Solirubrobacter ginsenosidimutans]|uniref:DUF4097 domain-containing protein n=1 Tax=Solirubrobacter ginsenosidimutans TaxID=490573 RepID=A0A9X3N001_9ACTN|nr:DUF4097 family beta strand repeat-containing protein [Solirubrobacter ginsenosidimutans]MDA0164450.1 DUF4097 domain-containing protein [Solirubrobacter ginsenosidimutans]
MSAFETPQPIFATVDVVLGDVRITAGERDTTVVEVRPSDATNKEDVAAAEQTRVEFSAGRLLVKAPKLRSWLPRQTGGSLDVTIELPAGSQLHGTAQMADMNCEGRFGDCRLRLGIGQIRLEHAGKLDLKSGAGDIEVDHAGGHADITVGSGEVRVRELASSAVIKNSNGDSYVADAAGELRLKSANGSIVVDRAQAGVVAKTANGDVRVGAVARGAVVLETSIGDVEVGIPEGTAAWLDVNATAGRVHNALEGSTAPDESADKVELRARTSLGNIEIRRAR